jgi:PIN domain
MMQVILDANAFYDNPNITGTEFRLLSQAVSSGAATIVVPEVVLDEIVNTFGERLQKHLNDLVAAQGKLSWLTEDAYKATDPAFDTNKEQRAYRSRVRAKLTSLKAIVLPYPKTSHEDLAFA